MAKDRVYMAEREGGGVDSRLKLTDPWGGEKDLKVCCECHEPMPDTRCPGCDRAMCNYCLEDLRPKDYKDGDVVKCSDCLDGDD